ncbi:MAG TPA: hypothetical protein DCY13_17495 [Verrucomicrobiales bacterium]|nr:hypothetical protein [Verrucomicrobiales bacterium]
MKTAQHLTEGRSGANLEETPNPGGMASRPIAAPQPLRRLAGWLSGCIVRRQTAPPSILRNNTNLPLFLVGALALSLVCNFALKQSSAQASRYLTPGASIEEMRQQLRENPDSAALHSNLGELYMLQQQYKRAMFHLQEASRLVDSSDE